MYVILYKVTCTRLLNRLLDFAKLEVAPSEENGGEIKIAAKYCVIFKTSHVEEKSEHYELNVYVPLIPSVIFGDEAFEG